MAEELLTSIQPRPYTGIVSYLLPTSFLTITEFEKSTLAVNNWLDLPTSDQHKKGRKRCDPDAVFRLFGDFCDYEPSKVRAEMLTFITNDFNYFRDVSWLNLNMHKKSLSQWMDNMRNQNTPADELAIFTLSRLYKRHSVIYSKSRTWCTIGTSKPLSEKDVYLTCDIRLVQTGPRNFVSLIKKPSSCMPVMQFEPLETIYEGGYYNEEAGPSTCSNTETFLEDGTEVTQKPVPELDSKEPNSFDIPDNHDNESAEYCALHGCKINADDTILINNDANGKHTTEISFPNAISVCKPSETSKLNTFNPLEESEPNLDLCMNNQNQNSEISVDNTNSNSNPVQIITRKCVVKVRNLNPEEIDFLCGPKLLPLFTTNDSSLKTNTNGDELGVKGKPVSVIDPTVTLRTESDTPKHGKTIVHTVTANKTVATVDDTPSRNLRPRRNKSIEVTYPKPRADDDDGDSTDEYTPQSEKLRIKLDNKKAPSAARLSAQKRTHDEPKPHSQAPHSLG